MEQLTSLRTTELKFSVQPSPGAAQPCCSGGPALPAPVRRVCHLAGVSAHKAHVRPEESTATRDIFAKSVTSTPLLVEPASARECMSMVFRRFQLKVGSRAPYPSPTR